MTETFPRTNMKIEESEFVQILLFNLKKKVTIFEFICLMYPKVVLILFEVCSKLRSPMARSPYKNVGA